MGFGDMNEKRNGQINSEFSLRNKNTLPWRDDMRAD